MMLIHSTSSRSAKLLGSLAVGLGLALFAGAPGCSSDDTAPSGGAGSGSTGTAGAGGGTAGSGGGTAGAAGGTADASSEMAPLCARFQRASDLGDHCDVDGGTLKQPATTCPSAGDAATAQSGDGGVPFSHSGNFTDDDNCKYDVTYGVMCAGSTTTFSITLKSRTEREDAGADAGAKGVTGANPQVEVTSQDDPTHKLPSSPKPVTKEIGNGEYEISNVPLDIAGFWTVRFTFFPMCADTEATSKHGGVSFTVITGN